MPWYELIMWLAIACVGAVGAAIAGVLLLGILRGLGDVWRGIWK